MKPIRLLAFLWPLALAANLSAADLKLAALFSDHMVIQREKAVPVWGWADPGEKITVTFGDQTKTATADATGKWLVRLDSMPASAEARELVVTSSQPGGKITVVDVLVGEVWLGSGQSNMALTVQKALRFPKEQAAANLPRIRMFTEDSPAAKTPQADASGSWAVCAPDTVGKFSATLFFFGRELHRKLDVPVGLINSSVGGTAIQLWIAAETQAADPELKSASGFDPQAGANPAPKKPASSTATQPQNGGPGGLFNGKIAPLIPYALRGVVWYQGEANTKSSHPELYQQQLTTLITDWRKRWNDEFFFAWVQLPNFIRPGEGWPRVREAMLKTLQLPRTGMAVTIDIGMPDNIHPLNKQEVGRRLSLWALGDVYQKKVASTCGPLPTGHEVKGSEVTMAFSHADGGLRAREGDLTGFEIAAADRMWKPGVARIEGDKVIVSHPDTANPVAVRYAWADNPTCNLINSAGLPASPFRTDDWPANSDPKAIPASMPKVPPKMANP